MISHRHDLFHRHPLELHHLAEPPSLPAYEQIWQESWAKPPRKARARDREFRSMLILCVIAGLALWVALFQIARWLIGWLAALAAALWLLVVAMSGMLLMVVFR